MPRLPATPAFYLVLFGAAAAFYGLVACWFLPPQALWSPDEGAKLLQLKSLRWEAGQWRYDLLYPGRALDPQLQFAQLHTPQDLLRVRAQQLYFQRLPLFPALVWPWFQWWGMYGLYLWPVVGGAATGVLAWLLLPPAERRGAMWGVIAFGSPVTLYATIFWEHTLATACALAGAWLLFRWLPPARQRSPGVYLGLGVWLGFSVYLRQEILLFVLAYLVAQGLVNAQARGSLLWVGLGLALTLAPFPLLHRALFAGQAVADNQLYLFYPGYYLQKNPPAQWLLDLFFGPPLGEAPTPGWLGRLWVFTAIVAIALGWERRPHLLLRAAQTFCLSLNVVVAAAFLFTPLAYRSGHGLLFTAPWVVVGLSRLPELWHRGPRHLKVLVLTTVLGLGGYTVGILGFRAGAPHGGLEWGARFAMVFYPLLALLTFWHWSFKQAGYVRGLCVVALCLLGVGFQLRGFLTIRHDKALNHQLNQALSLAPNAYVLSDLSWLPLNTIAAPAPPAVFVAASVERLTQWLALARAAQVTQFTLVTLNPHLPDVLEQATPGESMDSVVLAQAGYVWIFQVQFFPAGPPPATGVGPAGQVLGGEADTGGEAGGPSISRTP